MDEPELSPTHSTSLGSPPSYSPSVTPVPSYTAEPHEDEESLEVVVRSHSPTPRGLFTVKAGDITLTLHEQEFGAGIPTYRQNAVLKGDLKIAISTSEPPAVAVLVKIEGRQKLTITDIGGHDRVLFSEIHELWKKSEIDMQTPPKNLELEFHVPFPLKFVDKDFAHPLVVPPSFNANFTGQTSFSARNEYTLSVIVNTGRPASRAKHDSVVLPIPINYMPRSRPYLPIAGSLLPFFSTLKTAPEEWHQVSSSIPCKDGTQAPMECHLLIPHAQIYALGDAIPFHLQLRASTHSLRMFLGIEPESVIIPSNPELPSLAQSNQLIPFLSWATLWNESTTPPARTDSETLGTARTPVVRVYLRRQVSVKVKGVSAWKDLVIGEGILLPVEQPPAWSPSAPPTTGPDEMDYSLDWEGYVSCGKDVTVPSFVSGDLHVKDYIVVHLRPADLKRSAHIEHYHSHTIRFVTDKYREIHPSDR